MSTHEKNRCKDRATAEAAFKKSSLPSSQPKSQPILYCDATRSRKGEKYYGIDHGPETTKTMRILIVSGW